MKFIRLLRAMRYAKANHKGPNEFNQACLTARILWDCMVRDPQVLEAAYLYGIDLSLDHANVTWGFDAKTIKLVNLLNSYPYASDSFIARCEKDPDTAAIAVAIATARHMMSEDHAELNKIVKKMLDIRMPMFQ